MSSRRYRRRLERPRCHAPRLIPAGHGRRAEAGLLARGSIAPPSFADGELAAYSCGHSAGFEPASLFTAPIRDSTKVVISWEPKSGTFARSEEHTSELQSL